MDTIQHTVPSPNVRDRYTVEAIQPSPGLLIYLVPVERCEFEGGFHWRVVHQSGFTIAACEDERDALFVAQAIADFTDWNRSAAELRADKALDISALYQLITYETPGWFLRRQPAAV